VRIANSTGDRTEAIRSREFEQLDVVIRI